MTAAAVAGLEHVDFDFLGEVFKLVAVDDFDEFEPLGEVPLEDGWALHEELEACLGRSVQSKKQEKNGCG